jgi:hypothetical protein
VRLADLPPAEPLPAPAEAQNVTNHFALPGDGMVANFGCSSLGALFAAGALATSGLIPISTEMRADGFSHSLEGAAVNWLVNGATVVFFKGATLAGNFVSTVTDGVTLAGNLRSLTCSAASIPGTGTHYLANHKWAQGLGSLVYATSNEIGYSSDPAVQAAALAALAGRVMVNSGLSPACLTGSGMPGTVESVSDAPDLAPGQFLVVRQGYNVYVRKPWIGGKHMVFLENWADPSHDFNNCYQFESVVLIDAATPAALTPGAWSAGFNAVGDSPDMIAAWSDNHPAVRANGMAYLGAHGTTSSLVSYTAGDTKTKVDQGSIWSFGGADVILSQVYSPTKLFFTYPNIGTHDDWNIPSTTIVAGTLTHVSGATHTDDITASGGVLAYLLPATNILENAEWLDGGQSVQDADGAFVATLRYKHVHYQAPNPASVLDWLVANVGSAEDVLYNDPAKFEMQFDRKLGWIDDAWSKTTIDQHKALTPYFDTFSWPTQWGIINPLYGGNSLWEIVPATKTCAASVASFSTGAVDHLNGSPTAFSAWCQPPIDAPIGTGGKEFYHDKPVWQDADWWADGIQRAPWGAGAGVQDADDNWLVKFYSARSYIMGDTRTGGPLDAPEVAHFRSTPGKHYGVTRWQLQLDAGDVHTVLAATGMIDPGADPMADISFAFPLGGGLYEWHWWAAEAVADYAVPLPDAIAGKQIAVADNGGCRSSGCTVGGTARAPLITASGQGQGFIALCF